MTQGYLALYSTTELPERFSEEGEVTFKLNPDQEISQPAWMCKQYTNPQLHMYAVNNSNKVNMYRK